MEEDMLFYREDYETQFDPREYLGAFFSSPEGYAEAREYHRNNYAFWSSVFSSGKIQGSRILDLGSGPCIDHAIPASKYFTRVYLSDYTEWNRTAVKNWLDKKPEAHNWRSHFEFFAEKEGISADELESRTRNGIKGVLCCDVLADNVLNPEDSQQQFDCIMSSLCLESACKTTDEYKKAVGQIFKLVHSGGTFILAGVLNQSYYLVGQKKYHCLSTTMAFIEGVLKDTGFVDVHNIPYSIVVSEDFSDAAGYFFLTAKKP